MKKNFTTEYTENTKKRQKRKANEEKADAMNRFHARHSMLPFYIFSLFSECSMVNSLSAAEPTRPYLALTGDLDAGSPADGIKIIEAKAGGVYAALDARDHFKNILYPNIGHTYTPEMWAEMLACIGRSWNHD